MNEANTSQLCYFRNIVENVQIIETCLNERVSNWPMLTVSARSGPSGKTKTNVSQNSDLL